MSNRPVRTPSYRHHKRSGQAVVTLNGRDHYLGPHGSPESRAEYDRLIAEWLSNGRRSPKTASRSRGRSGSGSDLTINEMLLAYLRFAEGYYVKNGTPTQEPDNIRWAVRPLRKLYGHTLAQDFGPLALKAVRQTMIDSGLCRAEINRRVGRIVRVFKWAVSEELIPAEVHHGLRAVSGLRFGRSEARESDPVRPVPDAFVDAIESFVSCQVWAMVELQRLSGMRPGEVVSMRTIDLDTTGRVWTYTPADHKTSHHGKARTIFLGPQAQAILRSWIRTELEALLFSPAEAEAERKAVMRAARKTSVQPSQRNRAKPRRKRKPGDAYTVESYRRAIARAIKQANTERAERGLPPIPHWHPHQLRHNAATRLRKEFGLDAARAVLGHSSPIVTEVYAELDAMKAAEVMERVG
ncbi:tyrosine-type recombinase/integrase [Tautonia rosea]|uniref:tyrosine-type recombinase/integrase n=1 Tax=Tautonia rosea TaxID=2728037 RepID=UPI0014740544|nr:site-specific integrase [Tautonia rosea]